MGNEVKNFIKWLIDNDIAFTHIDEAVKAFRSCDTKNIGVVDIDEDVLRERREKTDASCTSRSFIPYDEQFRLYYEVSSKRM